MKTRLLVSLLGLAINFALPIYAPQKDVADQQTKKRVGSRETTWEGTSKVTGGTGKFKNVKGGGTYRGKRTAEGASTEFEVEVEY